MKTPGRVETCRRVTADMSEALTPLVYLPAPIAARLRTVCKDLTLSWLRLRRHADAQSLQRLLHHLGLGVDFTRLLEPKDTPLVWKCIAEEVFERSCTRACVPRDPFKPRKMLRVRRRPHLVHLVG